jgi:hypothetical protein
VQQVLALEGAMVCGLMCFMPVHGFFGFLSTPHLYPDAIIPYLLLLVLALVILVLLFTFTFTPQLHYIEQHGLKVPGLDAVVVVLLIFMEVTFPTILIGKALFDKVVHKIMDHVMEDRGLNKRLKDEFGIDELPEEDLCCGKLCQSIVFSLLRIAVMLLTLPINDLPILGTVLWLLINGWVYSWDLLSDYLPLFGRTTARAQGGYGYQHRLTFASFGATALALTLIPIIGPLFFITNAYGAALFFESLVEISKDEVVRGDYKNLEEQ